jgi:hypothetical protein
MTPTGLQDYSARVAYPSLLVQATATPVTLQVYRNGALVPPLSGTYALLAPGGGAVVTHAVSVVDDAAAYTVPAASLPASLVLGEGYMEVWSLFFEGEAAARQFRRTACLALCPIYPVVADLDLIAEYGPLADQFTASFTTYQGSIDQAWKEILSRLIEEGRLPYMIRTPDALRRAHLHLSLCKVFQGFGLNAEGNHYRELAKMERQYYEDAFRRMSVQLDQLQIGLVDNAQARAAASGPVAINGGQPRGMQRYVYSRYGV